MSVVDVVVLGSGIGGSTAAALLAKAGLRTLLVEKNPRVGGSCSWYEKRGFVVDYGTHLFTRGERGPLGVALRRVGVELPFLRVDDLAEVRGPGLKLVLPAQSWRLPYFCAEAVRQLRIPARELPRIVRLFYDLVTMKPDEIARWDDRTIEEFVDRYTKDPRLFGLFGFLLGLYFILPPWEVSAGEAIFCFQAMVKDNRLSYPAGGASAIPRALVRALERFGGQLRTRAGADSLERLPSGGWRVGLHDGTEVHARAVVSTTSLRDLVRLVGAEKLPDDFVRRVSGVRKSYIAVQAKVALPRKHESAGCIVGGWARDPSFDPWNITRADYRQELLLDLDAGRVPSVVPVYCPIPSNFDPSLAPPGAQLLTACAVAPCTDTPRPESSTSGGNARRGVDDRAFIDGLLRAMESLMPGCLDGAIFVDTMGTEALPPAGSGLVRRPGGVHRPDA